MLDALEATFPEAAIRRLVETFYRRVRDDELLAPVFASRIEAWEPHLDRMTLFWTSVLLGRAGYRPVRGSPRALHQRLDGVTHAHFDRWLELFERTAHDVLEPEAARNVVQRSRRMAVHLSGHLAPDPVGQRD